MAEICKDIDEALAQLNTAVAKVNSRINNLEKKQKECCDKSDKNLVDLNAAINRINSRLNDLERKQNENNNNNNNGLEKRVKELEKNQEALKTGIVESLNNFADIENTNRDFSEAFQGLYQIVTPLMDVVSTVIEFLGADE
ncbi:MAG: hypothetical protein RMX97_02650 [Nostoc sp. DedQUE11]|nr:hypothetical protein [Nostoc sp. DedQUE11]